MDRKTLIGFALLSVLFAAGLACAGDFDGSKPLLCAAENGIEYNLTGTPKEFDPENVGLPKKFIVDFNSRKIQPTQDSIVRRTTKIEQSRQVEDKLILQGADEGVEGVQDGIGWSMAIAGDTGKFVISASGTSVGYIIFGSCKCNQ